MINMEKLLVTIYAKTIKKFKKNKIAATAQWYGLDDRGVPVPAGAGNFSLSLHRVQIGSEAHPASYPMGTRVSFPVGKAAGE